MVNETKYDAPLRAATDAYVAWSGLSNDQFFALAKAVMRKESAFQPGAYRAEPQINDASRGLMQVLGATARGLGYNGDLGDDRTHTGGLYDPGTNILLGVRLLADNLSRANGNVDAAISAYNGGFSAQRPSDGKRTASGAFINQAYVDSVLALYQGYQVQGGISPSEAGISSAPLVFLLGLGGLVALALRWGR